MNEDWEYPRTLKFRLGLSTIHAFAELIDPFYPHVIKATLQHNAWHRFVAAGLSWLPGPLQRFVKRAWPRYALPDCVVLKKLRKREHTECFENEQAMYQRLVAAQGSLIPHYYGEANCEGDRTCVFSLFPWPTVLDQPLPRLTIEEFRDRIEAAISELAQYDNVIYDDPKLNNIMIAEGGRLVFVDLEWAAEAEPGQEAISQKMAVAAFMEQYKLYIKVRTREDKERAESALIASRRRVFFSQNT